MCAGHIDHVGFCCRDVQGASQAISTNPIADVLRDLLPPEVYYRFSPEGTSFGVAIDQTDKAKIDELMSATHAYVGLEDERFTRIGERLALPGDRAGSGGVCRASPGR